MGFLSRLLGGQEERNATVQVPALGPEWAARGVTYDAGLVNRLQADHQELVRILAAIKTATGEGRFHHVPDLLSAFKVSFQTHLMLENVKFYGYVQQHCAKDADTSTFLSEMRREMEGIARAVVRFVNTHTAARPTPESADAFNAELEHIGEVLLRRVEMEEDRLYSLYQRV